MATRAKKKTPKPTLLAGQDLVFADSGTTELGLCVRAAWGETINEAP